MNFLAHLHIADHCDSSLLGNLLGDFVKGDPAGKFQPHIVDGIKLHRLVDSYTDHHEVMKPAKQMFSGTSRRFAPIALDVFWDHCLASKWQTYHSESLAQFCKHSEVATQSEADFPLPERFKVTTGHMWKGKWLESYQELDNIEYALQRMSKRSPRMAGLASCFQHIEANYAELQLLFDTLYPDVLNAAKRASF
ncbi:DUF479 domain-containing protein [Vibrio sp. SCSIO 43135]|nr:ACP phosphodiesterase [Vibrio sp. SCSIO 43135]USD42753.1 DUF479 domain-containing protein [Vibrio sp. SCSIO 43135]